MNKMTTLEKVQVLLIALTIISGSNVAGFVCASIYLPRAPWVTGSFIGLQAGILVMTICLGALLNHSKPTIPLENETDEQILSITNSTHNEIEAKKREEHANALLQELSDVLEKYYPSKEQWVVEISDVLALAPRIKMPGYRVTMKIEGIM